MYKRQAVYPAVPSFAAAWERNANGSYVAADGSALTGITARGIDVSHWKQSINWNAVAADDVQFVMLGTKYNNEVDPYFSCLLYTSSPEKPSDLC